jgi:hypothetical protein
VFFEPAGSGVERFGCEYHPMRAALDTPLDQAGIFEHTQVLRHGRQRDVERLGELSNRRGRSGQPLEDRAPHRMGEGTEGCIQRGRSIVNHWVNNNHGRSRSQHCRWA